MNKLRESYEVVFEIPFNSLRKWHLVIAREAGASQKGGDNECQYILMMKGAPEVLIKKCSTFFSENGVENIKEEFILDFQDAYLHFGKEGIQFSHTIHRQETPLPVCVNKVLKPKRIVCVFLAKSLNFG